MYETEAPYIKWEHAIAYSDPFEKATERRIASYIYYTTEANGLRMKYVDNTEDVL